MSGVHLRVLLRLDRARAAAGIRHPDAGAIAGALIPLLLALGLVWSIGRTSAPRIAGPGDAATLGMLVAGPVAYLAYGTLFRSADAALLRRLGIDAGALYAERAMRLLLLALGIAALAVVPFAAGGGGLVGAALVAIGAAAAAWGSGAAVTAGAALAMARHRPGERWGCLMSGIRDSDLAAVAPLAYAPLVPFLAGTAAGAMIGAGGVWLAPVIVASVAAAARGAAVYERALPRFGPQALEMAYAPSADPHGHELRARRGVARVMPRRPAAVWARDAAVAARRFPWAARLAWPVTIGALVVLARWGREPVTHAWIIAAVALVLLAQALASVGLGRSERRGPRWLDRSLGIGAAARLAGRWAWGWGLSLWMTVPVALAWWWWSGAPGAWAWPLAGGAVAGVAAVGSLAAAGRR